MQHITRLCVTLSNQADAIVINANTMHTSVPPKFTVRTDRHGPTEVRTRFSFLSFYRTCNSRSAPPASPIQSRRGRRVDSPNGGTIRRCAPRGGVGVCVSRVRRENSPSKDGTRATSRASQGNALRSSLMAAKHGWTSKMFAT